MKEVGDGRRFVLALAVIAAVAVGVRTAYVLGVTRHSVLRGDAQTYHLLARALASGRGYVRPFGLVGVGTDVPTAEFPPLFPGLLAVLDLAGVDGPTAQKLALAALGALTAMVVAVVARRLAGPTAGMAAGAVVAVHPAFFESDAALMAESLYVLVIAGVLYASYGALRTGRPRAWALLGALIGGAALVRAEALALLVILVLPSALLRRRPAVIEGTRRERVKLAAVTAAVAIAVVAPWTLRNAIALDAFVPVSSSAGTMLAGANCDTVYEGDDTGLWSFDCVLAVEAPLHAEAPRNAAYLAAGTDYMVEHAGSLPRVATIRALRTWGAFDPGGQLRWETVESRDEGWHRLGYAVHVVVVALAILGASRLRRSTTLVPLGAMAGLVTLVAVVAYGNQRFRAPADVALAVLAGVAVAGLLSPVWQLPTLSVLNPSHTRIRARKPEVR